MTEPLTVAKLQAALTAFPANARISLSGHCCGGDTRLGIDTGKVLIHIAFEGYMDSWAEFGSGKAIDIS